jgi:hypothetical protein
MQAVEVVVAQLAILASVAQNAESDDREPMGGGHSRFTHAMLTCLAVKERGDVRVW